jgi:hypothetical protein
MLGTNARPSQTIQGLALGMNDSAKHHIAEANFGEFGDSSSCKGIKIAHLND